MSETVRITCVAENCGTFPMDQALVQKLKRTGDTFSCPAGHEQHFTESPEKNLKERIKSLEKQLERSEERRERLDERVEDFWEDWKAEKRRRKFLESRLLDYAKGVVEVGEEQYRWSCECDSRGQKAFDDPEDALAALKRHRRRNCPVSDPVEVTMDAEQ